MPEKIRKTKPLKKNAVIGLISPASPQRDEDRLHRSIRYLESLGYRVAPGRNLLKRFGGYLAGTDEERLSDLHEMFADPDIDAVFCARGGYGSTRYLDRVDYSLIRRNPKIFVGFSDMTALQSAIFKRTGLITFSGAMPSVDMADGFEQESEEFFWRMLSSSVPPGNISPSEKILPLISGVAEGRLICGNLTMFTALCGTKFSPDYRGKILLAEEIGEEPYRIDRMLMQLEGNGVWRKLAGLAFGKFTHGNLRPTSVPQREIREVIEEFAGRAGLPAIQNLMYGHTAKKLTLPFGIMAKINGDKGEFSIVESPFE